MMIPIDTTPYGEPPDLEERRRIAEAFIAADIDARERLAAKYGDAVIADAVLRRAGTARAHLDYAHRQLEACFSALDDLYVTRT